MKTIKGIVLILVISAVTGFTVNVLSPRGIALFGDWDTSKGVISAKAKNKPVAHGIEIQSVKEAYALFNEKTTVFVDARDKDSYDQGHIPGALSLSVYDYNKLFAGFMAVCPREKPVVTYCSGRECEDSHNLARYLKEDGYTDVRVFVDGFPAWEKEGLPVEKAD
jgi:rhodanese-related sulfurtransferase